MPARPARPNRSRGLALFVGLAALAVAICVSASLEGSEQRFTPIVKAVQRVRPSVVNIRGEKTVAAGTVQTGGVDAGRRVNGMGTGVVIDPRGYIVTNYHVIDGVREIQVTLADEKRYVAALVARDLETDLAIIKINCPQEVPVVPIGTSSDLMPGETVIAVGNAYGYEHTVTRGIVSALHRAVQVSDAQFYDDLIQTDAPINPGNSGGPLLNIDGEMIGINVAVRAGAQGIGFAIPADKALAVAAKMLAAQNGQKTWIGIALSNDAKPAAGAAGDKGPVVASVDKKSPAEEGGLETGDVIKRVGDVEVRRALDFQRAILNRKAGDTLAVTVERGGEQVTKDITLAEPQDKARGTSQSAWDLLGLELRPIPAQEFKAARQTRYRGGLSVTDVRPDSPAAGQGIRPGDVLVGMHIWETVTPENVAYILKRPDLTNISPMKFFILRGNETLYGYLPLTVKTAQR